MIWRALLLPVLLIGAAIPAAAQDERSMEVRKRNNCRLAAQVLSSGHPHPRYEWAQAIIVDCEEDGPAYFAGQWAAAPADTATLRELIFGSTRIRDARVYASLRQVAADATRPEAVRVAAMIALARYAKPSIAIDLIHLRAPAEPIPHIGSAVGRP